MPSVSVLFPEISYKIVGLAMDIHKTYGSGHKEKIYQLAFEEKLFLDGIKHFSEPAIPIFSQDTGNILGVYKPDLLIEEKIIVEIKAQEYVTKTHERQLRDYLRNSIIEVGYLSKLRGSVADV